MLSWTSRSRAIASALFLVIFLPALGGCPGKNPGEGPAKVPSVIVSIVEQKDIPVTFEYVGQTESSHIVEIRARIDGFLDMVAYEEGSFVKKGQVLFEIDKKPFEISLEESQAELAEQQAAWLNAKANLDRVTPLVRNNAVSKKDLDDAIGNERTLAAAVLAARAKVRQAELNLTYCTIKSPINGISSRTKKQQGSYISTSQDSFLTTVSQLDPIWVTFSISENEYLKMIDSVKEGSMIVPGYNKMTANLTMSDGRKYSEKGRLTFTEPSFSEETGTFLVRAEFKNPSGFLKPGQFVKLYLSGVTRPKAIAVPRKALNQGTKGHFTWVVKKDNTVEFRDVDQGEWFGDSIFILNGLKPGEMIVVDGGLKLSPGMKVKLVKGIPGTNPAADSR